MSTGFFQSAPEKSARLRCLSFIRNNQISLLLPCLVFFRHSRTVRMLVTLLTFRTAFIIDPVAISFFIDSPGYDSG